MVAVFSPTLEDMITSPMQTEARKVFTSPVLWLAFGFGSGLAPRAPGTAGTLIAIPLYLVLARLPLPGYLLAVALISLAGVWICQKASQQLGVHDHPGIVWDEFAGYLVTMIPAPAGWPWVVAGFVLFRVFDIWKPWPVSWADRQLKGGLGIMVDDLLAGAIAGFILWCGVQFI